ncbi:MAG: hypothetical protein ACRBN8_40240 [Nannocystales bacterium]
MSAPTPWEVLVETPGYTMLRRSTVLLCRLRSTPTPLLLRGIERALEQHPEPMTVVIHVEASVSVPNTETRLAASRVMRLSAPRIAAWVVVLEGSGLIRTALRSVANTVRLIARSQFPLRLVASAAEATTWLAEHSTAEITAEDIVSPVSDRAAS